MRTDSDNPSRRPRPAEAPAVAIRADIIVAVIDHVPWGDAF